MSSQQAKHFTKNWLPSQSALDVQNLLNKHYIRVREIESSVAALKKRMIALNQECAQEKAKISKLEIDLKVALAQEKVYCILNDTFGQSENGLCVAQDCIKACKKFAMGNISESEFGSTIRSLFQSILQSSCFLTDNQMIRTEYDSFTGEVKTAMVEVSTLPVKQHGDALINDEESIAVLDDFVNFFY